MGRAGLTAEQVHQAAQALSSEGINPTVAAIRQKLGSGSFTTITRHLSAWREADQPTAEPPPAMPESVAAIVGQVWQVACNEAQAVLQVEREALQLSRQEFEQSKAELMAEIRTLEADGGAMADDLDRLEISERELMAELSCEQLTRARLEEQVKAADAMAEQLRVENAALLDAIRAGALTTATGSATTEQPKEDKEPVAPSTSPDETTEQGRIDTTAKPETFTEVAMDQPSGLTRAESIMVKMRAEGATFQAIEDYLRSEGIEADKGGQIYASTIQKKLKRISEARKEQ